MEIPEAALLVKMLREAPRRLVAVALTATLATGLMASRVAMADICATLTSADQLPEDLTNTLGVGQVKSGDRWTTNDIIETRRISDVAVSEKPGHFIAFIVKQACVQSGVTRFGLYVVDADTPRAARRLLEASYLADLSVHPGAGRWTLRADLGQGVQLYDVNNSGAVSLVKRNPDLIDVADNLPPGEVPHKVGIASYDWAQDGSALWYSQATQSAPMTSPKGIVFDPVTMVYADLLRSPTSFRGKELHYFEPATGMDRLLAVVDPLHAWSLFRKDWGTVVWGAKSDSLIYERIDDKEDGELVHEWWRVDVGTGEAHRMAAAKSGLGPQLLSRRRFSIVANRTERQLVELDEDGGVVHKYGGVGIERVEGVVFDPRESGSAVTILEVGFKMHEGLYFVSPGNGGQLGDEESVHGCKVDDEGRFGACIRESLTKPPEVVALWVADRRLEVVARPNAVFDSISPLVHEHREWTNRYGYSSDGWITYPRGFQHGRAYPAVVITHYMGAQNRFADQGFQWDFDADIFAERGYIVLSVNEPDGYRASFLDDMGKAEREGPANARFHLALNGVATMEAALQSMITAGIADPARTAIAGYSRGGELIAYVMSQSKMFKVAAIGNGYWSADLYWAMGANMGRVMNQILFGGSPYSGNPGVIRNYQSLAPAFRGREFAGPLLMLFDARSALSPLELVRALSDAGVPNELVYFPGEGHLFWDPRDRAAVMSRTLNWFDYWLFGKREPEHTDQYSRWDAMAKAWATRRQGYGAEPKH